MLSFPLIHEGEGAFLREQTLGISQLCSINRGKAVLTNFSHPFEITAKSNQT